MEFLGQQITVALLVSAVTSLVVSILSFSIGIRVGKERVDRAPLRATYRSLYQHLGEIESELLSGSPKQWDDYPLKGSQYFPLAKDMEASGELAMLPLSLAQNVLQVESGVLNCAWKFRRHLDESVTPAVRQFLQQRLTSPDVPINGASYNPVKIGRLLLDRKAIATAQRDSSSTVRGIGIELPLDRSRSVTTYIYPEKVVSGTTADLLADLEKVFDAIDGSDSVSDELRRFDTQVKSLRKVIASRISDPHPFGETLKRSIPDMLKF